MIDAPSPPHLPRAHSWLAVGLAVATVGVALDIALARGADATEFWPAAAIWVVGSALAAAGLLQLATHDRQGALDSNALIDTAIVAVVGLTAAWQLLISPRYAESHDWPFGEVALLALVPLVMVGPLAIVSHVLVSPRRRGALGALLPLGAAGWVAFDVVLLGRSYDWVTHNPWSQMVWVAATVLITAWLLRRQRTLAKEHITTVTADGGTGAPDEDDPDRLVRASAMEPPAPTILLPTARRRPRGREVAEPGTKRANEWGPMVARVALTVAPVAIPSFVEGIRYVWRGAGLPWPALVASLVVATLTVTRLSRQFHAQRATRAELETSEQYFRALAASSADAIVIVDRAGRIVKGSPNLVSLLGSHEGGPSRSGAFPGADLSLLVSASSADVIDLIERAVARPGRVVSAELQLEHADGQQLWLAARAVNLLDDPSVNGIVVNLHDVTARKNTEQELERLAFHDVLTGLANRALFRDRIEHAIQRASRTHLAPAIIYFDLDGFKKVNDSLGHEAGDELLQQIARRVVAAVREGDTVARLGGDEFAVLVEYSSRPAEEAGAICDRILSGLSAPIQLDDQAVTVSASLGIALGAPGLTASSLLRHADIAMYRAKAEGKARWMVYEAEMSHGIVHRMRLESDLVGVLERSELKLVYQPIVRLSSGQLVGFEALLRWNHPKLGVLMPAEFLPIADETGAIVPIGRWALQSACRTAASWVERLRVPPEFSVGVNLSTRELAEPDVIDNVAFVLDDTGLPASALILEVSESVLGVDVSRAAKQLPALRELGARIALDDFGIGGSPLAHLQRLPIDFLKIDRSFIHAVGDDRIPPMVQALVELGRTLGITLLAEGIEHETQRAALAAGGCDLGQGHLFSPPVTATEAEELLSRAARKPEASLGRQ